MSLNKATLIRGSIVIVSAILLGIIVMVTRSFFFGSSSPATLPFAEGELGPITTIQIPAGSRILGCNIDANLQIPTNGAATVSEAAQVVGQFHAGRNLWYVNMGTENAPQYACFFNSSVTQVGQPAAPVLDTSVPQAVPTAVPQVPEATPAPLLTPNTRNQGWSLPASFYNIGFNLQNPMLVRLFNIIIQKEWDFVLFVVAVLVVAIRHNQNAIYEIAFNKRKDLDRSLPVRDYRQARFLLFALPVPSLTVYIGQTILPWFGLNTPWYILGAWFPITLTASTTPQFYIAIGIVPNLVTIALLLALYRFVKNVVEESSGVKFLMRTIIDNDEGQEISPEDYRRYKALQYQIIPDPPHQTSPNAPIPELRRKGKPVYTEDGYEIKDRYDIGGRDMDELGEVTLRVNKVLVVGYRTDLSLTDGLVKWAIAMFLLTGSFLGIIYTVDLPSSQTLFTFPSMILIAKFLLDGVLVVKEWLQEIQFIEWKPQALNTAVVFIFLMIALPIVTIPLVAYSSRTSGDDLIGKQSRGESEHWSNISFSLYLYIGFAIGGYYMFWPLMFGPEAEYTYPLLIRAIMSYFGG